MTPEAALRRAGSGRHGLRGLRLLHRLHAGPLKSSWLAGRGAERFVLRIDEPLAAGFAPDRGVEFAAWSAAAAAGIAPEPLLLWPGPPAVLVTRHAPGRAWRAAELALPGRIETLAGLLRRLHESRLPGQPLDLEASLDGYARRAGGRHARQLARAARRLMADCLQGPSTLCHHDPIPANVVGLRKPLLIDWEYAALGDPLFDLAVLLQHHRLPAALAGRLTRAYFGAAARVPVVRLTLARRLYDHVHCLWLLALAVAAPLTPAQQTQLATVTRRLNNKLE
ncbi:MAG: phosphotransferase [Gammaproteobacteria bacterium]|nr:MAG: phosphotransferase [Gammaproteobacteria bacterium]